MTRAFWLSLTFLAVYAIIFGVFVLGGLDEALAGVAAHGASILLGAFTGVDIGTAVKDGALWFHVPGAAAFPVRAALVIVYLPLFIAVVSAATPRYGKRFWTVLAVGVVVIFALETLGLTARLWNHARDELPQGIAFHAFQVLLKLSERGLAAVPAFIGAMLLWQREPAAARPEPPAPSETDAR